MKVESADRLEPLAPHQQRTRGAIVDPPQEAAEPVGWRASPDAARGAVSPDDRSGLLDGTIREKNEAPHRSRSRVPIRGRDECLEPTGKDLGVVVQKDKVFAIRGGSRAVAGIPETNVNGGIEHPERGPADGVNRRQTRTRLNALLAGLAAIAAVCGAQLLGWLERIELMTLDARFKWVANLPQDPRIVCLDIDDSSLELVGRWPWSRDDQAALISIPAELGAQQILVDLTWSEAEPLRTTAPRHVT